MNDYFTMIIICNKCYNTHCNIHYDADKGSFFIHCYHCENDELVRVDRETMPTKKESKLILEKKKIKMELKKLKN